MLVNRLERIPIHVRLARARRAAGNNHCAYRAFFEDSVTQDSQRAVGTVDVFSGVAATVCALELRVWEAIQHAFEARCPVPPEEQWRVRQVISDIAAARETLFLYMSHAQQKSASPCPRTAVVSSDATAAEVPLAVEDAETGADQQLPHSTVVEKEGHATSEETLGTECKPAASTGAKPERACRFEALVLTKTAWEMYLPFGTPETRSHPVKPPGSEALLGRLSKLLVNVGGLNIPKELHMHLEAFSSMYKTHFPERQLLWLWRAGHADMTVILRQHQQETQPPAEISAKVQAADFRVCLITAFVLLLFNEIPLVSAQTASHLIGVSTEEASSILKGLQTEPQNLLAGGSTEKGNEPLSPRRVRGPLDAEERAKLDAKLVRIFKQHRRLTHQQLMQILQRSAEKPSTTGEHADCCGLRPETVKSSLEGLISKEYIARDESDRNPFMNVHLCENETSLSCFSSD
ncbi:hypothetical protein, conserved [Eimeria maxima]|uniref:Cullin family profile domain-containing protein n=1 Tax=Eimeria maxima TaxID=5804 RepID=U6MAF8_EIMMA|nr:hypothetical protein, conserved [Eimeria maxima]CDJ58635.1 hypothetical protein, conserved [Eimeria maxima]